MVSLSQQRLMTAVMNGPSVNCTHHSTSIDNKHIIPSTSTAIQQHSPQPPYHTSPCWMNGGVWDGGAEKIVSMPDAANNSEMRPSRHCSHHGSHNDILNHHEQRKTKGNKEKRKEIKETKEIKKRNLHQTMCLAGSGSTPATRQCRQRLKAESTSPSPGTANKK